MAFLKAWCWRRWGYSPFGALVNQLAEPVLAPLRRSEKIAEDLARQAILERLGWQFYRIRGSVFFREPEQALAGLWQRLADLGIQPILAEHAVNSSGELLHHEIIRLVEQMECIIDHKTAIQKITSTVDVQESPHPHIIHDNDVFRQKDLFNE